MLKILNLIVNSKNTTYNRKIGNEKSQMYLVAVDGLGRELEGAEEMRKGEHGTGRHSLLQTHGQQGVRQVGEEHGGPDGAERDAERELQS